MTEISRLRVCGLVVELGLASGGGIALQGGGELVERLQGRILREIGKSQADVVGVVEAIGRDSVGFELMDELLVVHRGNSDREASIFQ